MSVDKEIYESIDKEIEAMVISGSEKPANDTPIKKFDKEAFSKAIDAAAKAIYEKSRYHQVQLDKWCHVKCPKCGADIALNKQNVKIYKKTWGYHCPSCGMTKRTPPALDSLYLNFINVED